MNASLQCRNVSVNGRRTSIRIHTDIWGHVDEICSREGISLNVLCSVVDDLRGTLPLTEALRVYTLNYWRDAAKKASRMRVRGGGDRQTSRGIAVTLPPTLLAGLPMADEARMSAPA